MGEFTEGIRTMDGPEAMGKTEAAKQRAQTVVRLNRERELQLVTAARFILTGLAPPMKAVTRGRGVSLLSECGR